MMKRKFLSIALFSVITFSAYAEELVYSKIMEQSLSHGEVKYFIEGKIGKGEEADAKCEDGLFFNEHYLAVFDGATDNSGKKYNGHKGGRVARDIIAAVFAELPANTPKEEVLRRINDKY